MLKASGCGRIFVKVLFHFFFNRNVFFCLEFGLRHLALVLYLFPQKQKTIFILTAKLLRRYLLVNYGLGKE
jgi:hypothetical protein